MFRVVLQTFKVLALFLLQCPQLLGLDCLGKRIIFKLKLIKNFVRNSCGQEDLFILHSHLEGTLAADLCAVVWLNHTDG